MPLHPFLKTMIANQAGKPGLSGGDVDDARAMVARGRAALGPGPEMAQVHDIHIPSRSDTSINARLLIPSGVVRGILVYAHGGGWVVGGIDDFDTLGRELGARTGCAVLLPDYRLAPENPFPAGLEDIEDVLLWAAGDDSDSPAGLNASALIAERLPLIVAGDSAGANLVTVALRRLGSQIDAALQILVYPVTSGDLDSPSYREFKTGYPLTRGDMEWFFGHYVGIDGRSDPDVVPLISDDLAELPRSLVVVAEYDVLADDGRRYAERLEAAGVPTTLSVWPGMTHGFLRLHNHLDAARDALDVIAAEVDHVTGPSAR
ncbi:MAG: esterase [Subtercola sp.]|nr:esterase [Subtercola sp.]